LFRLPARPPRPPRIVLRAAVACALATSLGALGASPELRRSLAAAGRAFADPSLVEELPVATTRAQPATPRLQLWPEEDDEALDLAIAAEFTGAREADLGGLGAVVLELAPRRLRVPVTRRTVRYVRFFTEDRGGRAAMLDRLRRFARYRPVLEEELRSAGVLDELSAVAAIESGFDPHAQSGKGAAGIWQFMPATAEAYGLVIGPGIDERRSLRRATRAAAAHLRDLYDHYGRWDLALAAYNAGMGRIDRAIEKHLEYRDPELAGTPPTFDELVRARLLPQETADYVPQITAFAIVAANRRLFDLEVEDEQAPLATAELPVPGGTRLRTVARAAETSVAELRELNPELLDDRVPAEHAERAVLVPADGLEHALVTFAHFAKKEENGELEEEDEERALAAAPASRPSPLAAALRLPADDRRRSFLPIGRQTPGGFTDATGPRPEWLGPSRVGTLDAVIADALGGAPAAAAGPRLTAALQLLPTGGIGVRWAKRSAVDTRDPLSGIDLERAGVAGRRSVDDAAHGAGQGRLEDVARRLLTTGHQDDDAAPPTELALRLLPPPPPREPVRFTVANVSVELWREDERPKARFALRAVDREPLAEDASVAGFRGEVAHVVEAQGDQLDVVASLLRGRLRVLRAERGRQVLAALRREANTERRNLIERAPYGPAWTTLADRLFPAGHPLEGTLVAARHDADEVLDAIVLDALRPRREGTTLQLRVEGRLERAQVQAVVERATRGLDAPWTDDAPIAVHPREEVVDLALPVPDPRLFVGWIAPPEGSADEAATRVALEILTGKKGRLRKELVERREIATLAAGRFEAGARAGVVTVELQPNGPAALPELDRALREELDRLGDEGPDPREVTYAAALLRSRIDAERRSATGAVHAGSSWEQTSARVRQLVDPQRAPRALAALGRVRAPDVRDAVRRVLGQRHRVVVVVRPTSPAAGHARGRE
jgi:membrane-bound lytic murein transglycosylase D